MIRFSTCSVSIAAIFLAPAHALTVTGYSSAANDRFSSGFPTAPVQNTNPAFVGTGYDWSAGAWSSTTISSRYKGLGMLSPMHFLTAQHFEYGVETTPGVRILARDGSTYSSTTGSISNLGQGLLLTNAGNTNYDLAIGRLNSPVTSSANLARPAVLDLHDSSGADTLGNYGALPVLLYGRSNTTNGSPRVGATTINLVAAFNSDPKQVAIRTTRTEVQLEAGDSGSPAFHGWTNPNGGKELTVLGTNSAVDATYNYISFLGTNQAMAAANQVMNSSGYALRVAGNASNTWAGSAGSNIAQNSNWGISGGNPNATGATSDKYVSFNGSTATTRTLTVGSAYNLRGLYFLSTAAAADGFAISGNAALTLGRGGITNYDNTRQTINAPIALGESQCWDGGAGGLTVGAIATNGRLLEINGGGVNRITGGVTGTGSLAVSGGTLEMSASNSYSGGTWVHAGTLVADNTTGSATGTGALRVASGAMLTGNGIIHSSTTISGELAPGSVGGIGALTVNNAVTWNSGNSWLFDLGLAADSLEGAALGESLQDRLVLGGSGGDFRKGSGSAWVFDFAGTGENGFYQIVDWSGITDFNEGDFQAINLAAGKSATFQIESSALYVHVIPEPSMWAMVSGTALLVLRRRRHTCKRDYRGDSERAA